MSCELIETLTWYIVRMGHTTDLKASVGDVLSLCASADASLQGYRSTLDAAMGRTSVLEASAAQLSDTIS